MRRSTARLARVAAPAAGLAGAAALAVAGVAAPADASSLGHTPHVRSGTVTVPFSYTGTQQTFTVPSGVTTVTITAIGAAGQTIGLNTGGQGAQVFSTVGVIPGQTLYVEVGGTGALGGFNG
jgi:hypothetical protein